ncbi:MAG: Mur ligase family protein [Thermomicrobiales bacterium]
MELVEIRDLDGPNIFLLGPAVKVEFKLDAAAGDLPETLKETLCSLHELSGQSCPASVWTTLETPGHVAFAFGWSHRRFALGVAKIIARLAMGEVVDTKNEARALGATLRTQEPTDLPLMVRDADRTMPIVSITGTNGKTTTTRLTAHILRTNGRKVGLSSSSGVFIEGEQVMEGDYTGPVGAMRVLNQPGLEAAILETARGGILLRGIAYESNDVGVFTNVSADHLDLQGVRTVEGLASVKSVVIRITQPDGVAVLNADDPLVAKCAAQTQSKVCFVSQRVENSLVRQHIDRGGLAVVLEGDDFVAWREGRASKIVDVKDIPITFGGSARHMIENALCAAAASLAMDLDPTAVREGLITFSSSADDNLGRLNVYDVDGSIVIVDFAHNEAGLRHLLSLADQLKTPGSRLVTIIGTAGDRTDANLFEIGRIAAEASDSVIVKETVKYLRGRASNDELNVQYVAGIQAGGKHSWSIEASELAALTSGLRGAGPGDLIAMMCVEQVAEVRDYLNQVGKPSSLGQRTR